MGFKKGGVNNSNPDSVKARLAHGDKPGAGKTGSKKQGFGGIKRK